jgi:hypothetical protein
MPKMELELLPGLWISTEVSHADRRQILLASNAATRFITPDGTVQLAHPLNIWCCLSAKPIAPTPWEPECGKF